MDNSTLNISIHICIYERRVDPKVPGSSPTVSRNVGVHYLLQSSILLLEITIFCIFGRGGQFINLFFMHFFISSNHCSLGTASTEGQYIMPLYWLCPVSAVLNCPHFLHVLRRTLQV